MRSLQGVFFVLAGALVVASGCSSAEKVDTPDERLEREVRCWEKAKENGDKTDGWPKKTEVEDVALIRHRFEALADLYPNHVPTLVANGIVAYDAHQPERAQQYLDRALSLQPVHPEAAILRARIASEEGDLPLAQRLLAEQIRATPDHSGLREAHASVFFEQGRLDEARGELDAAQKLGAPAWRVAFNLGLIEETAGHSALAIQFYKAASDGNPECDAARSRLRALEAVPPPPKSDSLHDR
jgi:tetratricopeptide (TPR) repeat protein